MTVGIDLTAVIASPQSGRRAKRAPPARREEQSIADMQSFRRRRVKRSADAPSLSSLVSSPSSAHLRKAHVLNLETVVVPQLKAQVETMTAANTALTVSANKMVSLWLVSVQYNG
jgi:hypothetical protein